MGKKLIIALTALLAVSENISRPVCVQADGEVPIYQVQNPSTDDVIYTADETERENLIMSGWDDQGIGFYENSNGRSVYRLYSSTTGMHIYTYSSKDKRSLMKNGWINEGIVFHSSGKKEIALSRLSNADSSTYQYVTGEDKKKTLLAEGWQDEGVYLYAAKEGDPSATAGFYHYTLPYYSQLDSRWGSQYFGSYTFASTGCVPSSLAMVLQAIKGTEILPTEVGTNAHAYSNYNNRNPGSSDTVVPDMAAYYGVNCDNIQSEEQLEDALKHGKPCLIVVDGINAFLPETVAHCVVMNGYDNGMTTVSDPYFTKNNTSWSIAYMWSIRTVQSYLLDKTPYYCFALYG